MSTCLRSYFWRLDRNLCCSRYLSLKAPLGKVPRRLLATNVEVPPFSSTDGSSDTSDIKTRRRSRILLYSSASLVVGFLAGQALHDIIVPPPLPVPGTPEDALLLSQLQATLDDLPIVRSLRSDKDHKWREWEAYSSIPTTQLQKRLTTGPMGGARGLAIQRVFWNDEEQKAISIVFFGGALAGWPGITHGGAIATVMDESLGRAALLAFPAKTGKFVPCRSRVKGAQRINSSRDLHSGVTANLELNYRAPTPANQFYVLVAEPMKAECTDRKARIKGRLETLDGKVCVEATGLFVVPKGLKLGEIKEGF